MESGTVRSQNNKDYEFVKITEKRGENPAFIIHAQKLTFSPVLEVVIF